MATTIRPFKVENLAYIRASNPNAVIDFGDSVRLTNYIVGQETENALLGTVTPSEDPNDWKYNRITDAYAGVSAIYELGFNVEWATLSIRGLNAPYNPATVTWNNAPGFVKPWTSQLDWVTITATTYYRYYLPRHENGVTLDPVSLSAFAKLVINNGFAITNIDETGQRNSAIVRTGKETPNYAPLFAIRTDDEIIVTSTVVGADKTSGYYPRNVSQTFSWKFEKEGSYYCYGDWTQASAVFHWRSGTDGAWNDITASGSTQSVTIPANTFPLGTVQWYVSAVDNVGTASSSEVYTISTADAQTVATPVSPIGEVVDGSADSTFSWTDANDNGTTPTGADLQISTDGTTWTDLASVSGSATTYTVPADTLPGGQVSWRVRAYNADNVAGPWSEAASFISVAAPPAPVVSVNAVPFATITWQSVGQQAYKITIDGVSYGPFFGTAKEYRLKDYLEDGEHTASVEIQGVYGLWSQPGSVTFTVANVPGDDITLTGSFDRDAALNWTTASATADFLVYRDDKQIAATSVTGYADRFVLGAHSYQVINRLSNGNYTASNVVNGVMRSCTTAIAPFNGGAWQELKLSENSYSEQRFSWAKLSSTRHVTGAVYPVIEVSEYEDSAGSYDVSFPDVESANAFLALRGQIVILKSRGGNVVIGALTQIEQANKDFYISFAFTIQRIDWEDYVDAQNS